MTALTEVLHSFTCKKTKHKQHIPTFTATSAEKQAESSENFNFSPPHKLTKAMMIKTHQEKGITQETGCVLIRISLKQLNK